MKDEIKEILNKPKILMLSYGNYISLDDYVKLKDYITNLQQENKKIRKDFEEANNLALELLMNEKQFVNTSIKDVVQELTDKITNLQEENKILKENAEHNDKVVDKAKWNEMIYKSRIDKAIEYINTHYLNANEPELLNILKGSDKE